MQVLVGECVQVCGGVCVCTLHCIACIFLCFTVRLSRNLIGFAASCDCVGVSVCVWECACVCVSECVPVCVCSTYAQFIHFVFLLHVPTAGQANLMCAHKSRQHF